MIDSQRKVSSMEISKWKTINFFAQELPERYEPCGWFRIKRVRYPRYFIPIFDKLNQLRRL